MRRVLLASCLSGLIGGGTAAAQSKPLERAVAGTTSEARVDHIVQGGVRLFLVRNEGDRAQLFVQGPGGNQRLVFDPKTVDASTLAWADIGSDGNHAIVGLTHGAETDAVVIDAKNGQFGGDRFPKAAAVAWLSPTRVVYRVRGGKAKTAKLHELGADVGKDVTLPVPSDNVAITTAPGSTWAIAAVLDEARAATALHVAPVAKLGASTKWRRLADATITNVTSYALDGNTLYFVSAAAPTVVKQVALDASTTKATVVIDAKTNVTALGVTGKTIVFATAPRSDAPQLWELSKGAAEPKTIAIPTGTRVSFFTDPGKLEVLITTVAADQSVVLYRFANGQLTPITVARAPVTK